GREEKSDRCFYALLSVREALSGLTVFRGPGDKVRVQIAPTTIACQHIRPTLFNRTILAIPIHGTVVDRDHCTPGSLRCCCGGPKKTPARAAMAPKINPVIVRRHARCPNNPERLPVFAANIISRRRNVLPPKADISRRNRQCPLWAKSEHRLRTHREN